MLQRNEQVGFNGGVVVASLLEIVSGAEIRIVENKGPMSTTAMTKSPESVAEDAKLLLKCSNGKTYALPLYEE